MSPFYGKDPVMLKS